MAKIVFTMANGTTFEKSRGGFGQEKPFNDTLSAEAFLQVFFRDPNTLSMTVDDGTILMVRQIATIKVVD
jgi:hypothetical protein